MREVVDFESDLYARDIRHCDIHPRNVIIITADSTQQTPDGNNNNNIDTQRKLMSSIKFIDFGDAEFGRVEMYPEPDPELLAQFLPGVYISPLLRWHEAHQRTDGFEAWIDWDWQPWLETEWAYTAREITEEMRRLWLSEEDVSWYEDYKKWRFSLRSVEEVKEL